MRSILPSLTLFGFFSGSNSLSFRNGDFRLESAYYQSQSDYLASLKSRLTGSTNHTILINYVETELKRLGFEVHSDHFEFEYNAPPSILSLTVDGQAVPPSAYVPYSGNTDVSGVTGELVQIEVPQSTSTSPDWELARGKIAVLNLFNRQVSGPLVRPVWPGFQPFSDTPGIPSVNPGVRNLTAAASAGVKGVIYNWMNVTSFNAFGQYGPFKNNYQGVPAIYVTNQAMEKAKAHNGSAASIISTGQLTENVHTRAIYVVVPGRELPHESVIINTHTDGTNAVQENGYIALLAKAMSLSGSPPRRTTVLVFLTGHLHTSGFTDAGRMMEKWLQDHPDLWAGSSHATRDASNHNHPGSGIRAKAIFGSCVEHMGGLSWREDYARDLYYPTGQLEDELLYAATSSLASLVGKLWKWPSAERRVVNPLLVANEQSGEGLPYIWHSIPEVSLTTPPDWLLKVFPTDFDQRQLVDVATVKRQTESFLRVWAAVDQMKAEELGVVAP